MRIRDGTQSGDSRTISKRRRSSRLGACVGLDDCLCGHFNCMEILTVTSSPIRVEKVSHKHGLLGGFGKLRGDLSHENQWEIAGIRGITRARVAGLRGVSGACPGVGFRILESWVLGRRGNGRIWLLRRRCVPRPHLDSRSGRGGATCSLCCPGAVIRTSPVLRAASRVWTTGNWRVPTLPLLRSSRLVEQCAWRRNPKDQGRSHGRSRTLGSRGSTLGPSQSITA